jgi:DNA-binding response OmpR family regulator
MEARKKILVIDDEDINLEFFEVMLSKLGFEVEQAGDGEQGLAKVKSFFPDLIILDTIMPKMSGWKLTKILKEDPKLKDIPIIMLSSLDDVKDKVAGFELGIDDYITKPFNFSEVLARIKAVLRNRELYAQLMSQESRHLLVEEFNTGIKDNVREFMRNIDDLTSALNKIDGKALPADAVKQLDAVKEKNGAIRKNMSDLETGIDKAITEWERLKKSETGITVLKKQSNQSLQEHE